MYQLHLGKNEDILPTLAENSVDSIVTDPPYGFSFMGNKWDYDVPTVKQWRECLRVLKPGGHLLAFGGARTYHRMAVRVEDAGFELRDQIMWLYGSGFPKAANQQLKPAHEPIIMARKPFRGSCEKNVELHGTGFLNIDECRVPTNWQADTGYRPNGKKPSQTVNAYGEDTRTEKWYQTQDRYPANVIHDGSDEILTEFAKYGETTRADKRTHKLHSRPSSDLYESGLHRHGIPTPCYSDTGTAARFFYCAKASPADRGPFNKHPTVKPTSLMRYLCKLVTPVGGIILDPFMGSGSTGKGAILEGFRFIGIDQDEQHMPTAKRRIEEALNVFS